MSISVLPPKPIFFLSYAHADPIYGDDVRDQNAPVMRLFYNLSAHLNHMVYRPTGLDPGAIDQTMRGGELWTKQLLQALGTCRVFVALTSPPYFGSKWCGMEWAAFAARVSKAADEDAGSAKTALLPVRWVAAKHQETPRANQEVQEFAPSMESDLSLYRRHGLYGLSVSGKHKDTYESVVLELAQRITELYYSVEIPELVPPSKESLPNIFEEAS